MEPRCMECIHARLKNFKAQGREDISKGEVGCELKDHFPATHIDFNGVTAPTYNDILYGHMVVMEGYTGVVRVCDSFKAGKPNIDIGGVGEKGDTGIREGWKSWQEELHERMKEGKR